jgi:hypothetical protein
VSKEVDYVNKERTFVVGSLILGNHYNSLEEVLGKG